MTPLLKAGASLEAINGHGESVFQLASARKNKYMSSQLEKEKTRRGIGRPSFIRTINTDPVSEANVINIILFAGKILMFVSIPYCITLSPQHDKSAGIILIVMLLLLF